MAAKILKSERHHWWPVCLSEHWKNANGIVHWLLPDGSVRTAPPKNFGVIGNGHLIKLANRRGETSPWDENFEQEYALADTNFPRLIDWLRGLSRKQVENAPTRADRFLSQPASDEQISLLVECLVSLAVRSPMNRAAAVGLAEKLRGPIPEPERSALIGSNMRRAHGRAVKSIGTRGKYVVLFSPEREFIFGDGFFHNITTPGNAPLSPQVLAPLTPEISVLIAVPMQYSPEPRLTTIVVSREEADVLNRTVQVYAGDALFYRDERPELTEEFSLGKHCSYSHPGNPIATFIHSIPGVPPRDTTFDAFIH